MKIKNAVSFHPPMDDMNQQEFERLMGDVIHKVKNNLGGISGFATLLARDVGGKSPHLRMIEQIQTSVMRLDDLVVDLMVFIRKPKIKIGEVNIRPLLIRAVSQYEERTDLKCKFACGQTRSAAPVLFNTDAFLIERLLNYIVRFAEHARGVLKQIHVTTDDPGLMRIDAQMTQIDLEYCPMLQIQEFIMNYEPVEARLAFTILVKLIRSLEGNISLYSAQQSELNLVIEIAEREIR